MAKKLKVSLKATDQKALDDVQDFEKMNPAEQFIIKNLGLKRYRFFSYDPVLNKNKHTLEVAKNKNRISPVKVKELLSPLIKDKDPYVSKAINHLLTLTPRCFWIEVSKAPGVGSQYDYNCTREYELGISDFAAHHAFKTKLPTDTPYDEELGLYKNVNSKERDFIYYYESQEELRNKILEVLRERSKNLNNPFFDILNNFKLEKEEPEKEIEEEQEEEKNEEN